MFWSSAFRRIGVIATFSALRRDSEQGTMQQHLLTILILLPVVGAGTTVIYSLTPGPREAHHPWIAVVFTTLSFLVSLWFIQGAGGAMASFRFGENYALANA